MNFCNWFFAQTLCSSTLKVIPCVRDSYIAVKVYEFFLSVSIHLCGLSPPPFFFFAGMYYHISKRASGIRYVFIGKPSNQRPRYGVLYFLLTNNHTFNIPVCVCVYSHLLISSLLQDIIFSGLACQPLNI